MKETLLWLISASIRLLQNLDFNYQADRGFDMTDDLAHYGKKGMKWGVRSTTGANIPAGAQRRMVKSENRFQNKREQANAQVRADRKAGVVNPKNVARATKLNAQNKKNAEALSKMGLEVYKNLPPKVKTTKVSSIKKTNSSQLTRGQKAATIALTGGLGVAIIRRAEGRSALTGRPLDR